MRTVKRRRALIAGGCLTIFFVALLLSLRQAPTANPVRTAVLTAVVRVAGHQRVVGWGTNCKECHAISTGKTVVFRKGP